MNGMMMRWIVVLGALLLLSSTNAESSLSSSSSSSSKTPTDVVIEAPTLPFVLQYSPEQHDSPSLQIRDLIFLSVLDTVKFLKETVGVTDTIVMYTPATTEEEIRALHFYSTEIVPVPYLEFPSIDKVVNDEAPTHATMWNAFALTQYEQVIYMDMGNDLLDHHPFRNHDPRCLDYVCASDDDDAAAVMFVCTNGKTFDTAQKALMVLTPNEDIVQRIRQQFTGPSSSSSSLVEMSEESFLNQMVGPDGWSYLPDSCGGATVDDLDASPETSLGIETARQSSSSASADAVYRGFHMLGTKWGPGLMAADPVIVLVSLVLSVLVLIGAGYFVLLKSFFPSSSSRLLLVAVRTFDSAEEDDGVEMNGSPSSLSRSDSCSSSSPEHFESRQAVMMLERRNSTGTTAADVITMLDAPKQATTTTTTTLTTMSPADGVVGGPYNTSVQEELRIPLIDIVERRRTVLME